MPSYRVEPEVNGENDGTESIQLSPIRNSWVDKTELEKNIDECSICLDETIDMDITLPCMHRFHRECIERWFSNSENKCCPICKRSYMNNSRNPPQRPRSAVLHTGIIDHSINIPPPLGTPPRIARFRYIRPTTIRVNS